jgi:hypothetical protein
MCRYAGLEYKSQGAPSQVLLQHDLEARRTFLSLRLRALLCFGNLCEE